MIVAWQVWHLNSPQVTTLGLSFGEQQGSSQLVYTLQIIRFPASSYRKAVLHQSSVCPSLPRGISTKTRKFQVSECWRLHVPETWLGPGGQCVYPRLKLNCGVELRILSYVCYVRWGHLQRFWSGCLWPNLTVPQAELAWSAGYLTLFTIRELEIRISESAVRTHAR